MEQNFRRKKYNNFIETKAGSSSTAAGGRQAWQLWWERRSMKLMPVAACAEIWSTRTLPLPHYTRTKISSLANTNLPLGGSCPSMWISSKAIVFTASFGAVAISAPAGVPGHCQGRMGFNCETFRWSQSNLCYQPAKQFPAWTAMEAFRYVQTHICFRQLVGNDTSHSGFCLFDYLFCFV